MKREKKKERDRRKEVGVGGKGGWKKDREREGMRGSE